MEQQLSAGLGEGEIPELVKDHEVEAGEVFGELALPPRPPLGLKPVDQIDGVEEAAAGSGTYAAPRDRDRQMRLAGTGSADQDDITLLNDEAAIRKIAHQRL